MIAEEEEELRGKGSRDGRTESGELGRYYVLHTDSSRRPYDWADWSGGTQMRGSRELTRVDRRGGHTRTVGSKHTGERASRIICGSRD